MCDSCKSTHSDGGPLIGLGPWARSKLHYLDNYADLFSTGMQYHWPSRAYLDLFSGPGMCSIRGTREVVAGSPLVALRQKTPFTHYAFIDSDKSHVEALQDRSEVVATASHKTILHGDCNDLQFLRAALKGIPSDALRLAFIDPFRFNIKFETLRALAAGRRIDFIIVFQIAALKRSLESGSRLIDDFFGDAGAWREIYATTPARRLTRALLDHYRERLSTLGYLEDHYPTEVPVRNSRNVPLYYLVFASKHQRGKEFWQKAIQKTETGMSRLPGF